MKATPTQFNRSTTSNRVSERRRHETRRHERRDRRYCLCLCFTIPVAVSTPLYLSPPLFPFSCLRGRLGRRRGQREGQREGQEEERRIGSQPAAAVRRPQGPQGVGHHPSRRQHRGQRVHHRGGLGLATRGYGLWVLCVLAVFGVGVAGSLVRACRAPDWTREGEGCRVGEKREGEIQTSQRCV